MLTPEGEELASDGTAHKSWMPVVEKVPVTTVDIDPHPPLDLPLYCVCFFFQIEPRFIKEKWERAEWERLQRKNTHAFFFAHLVCR